ncbi:MAG: tRNA epoxyqueuosine(34) reductase QueG [Bradymonadia bacterium]
MTSSIHQTGTLNEHLLSQLSLFAKEVGLDLMGAVPLLRDDMGWLSPHAERLKGWVKRGEHADMEWLSNRVEERCMPHQLLPRAKSALVFWGNHNIMPPDSPAHVTGRVARYAWGRDYHNVLRKSLRKIQRWLGNELGTFESYTSIDTGAILERAVCEQAGLGWIGRSTMLINQKLGSFGSLGVMFVDIPTTQIAQPHPFRCGTCTQCIVDCPTGALSEKGLDARLCISYWTIEHRGVIPRSFRPKIGEWFFGCDICQDVCPWNNRAHQADERLWQPKSQHIYPDLLSWLAMDSQALDQSLLGSPLRRAKPEGLRRNACIVLANKKHTPALPILKKLATSDPSPVVRATALWACRVLGSNDIVELCAQDESELVQDERHAELNQ